MPKRYQPVDGVFTRLRTVALTEDTSVANRALTSWHPAEKQCYNQLVVRVWRIEALTAFEIEWPFWIDSKNSVPPNPGFPI